MSSSVMKAGKIIFKNITSLPPPTTTTTTTTHTHTRQKIDVSDL
jgi:hypothetical protein